MTKAEAIAMLKRIQEPEAWDPQINQAAFEALDMAIEALSQESSEDVISRQAAIDAIMGQPPEPHYPSWYAAQIEKLPSAQPDAIPLEWIAKHLEWLDNCDNDFAQLAKVSIKAMVELWKKDRI